MPIKPVKEMVAAATAEIENISVADAQARMNDDDFVMVDIRDPRELDREGRIPGAMHAPRGMLEFWVDPLSPYHKIVFSTDRKLILFCASGMLSALATKTLMDMGMKNVMDMEGGFTEWRMQQLPIDRPT